MRQVTRRELLTSVLGATVANLACRSTPRRQRVPGAIVDRAFERGHLLRPGSTGAANGAPSAAAKVVARPVEVVIVGAGAAGLSAGWRLAGAGQRDFVVLELEQELGGTARSGRNAVSAYPWGAHYLPAPLESRGPVPRLLSELGVLEGADERGKPRYAEEALVADPEERLFYRGSWSEGLYLRAGASPEDLAELSRFEQTTSRLAAARDAKGRKVFAVPTLLGSDEPQWTALDQLSMAQWLEREGYRSPRLRWMVEYGCRDDYGSTLEQTSAWAGLWYFCARQEGGGERNAGYLAWPEGNGRLIAQLASSVGREKLRTDVLVHTVALEGDGCRVDGIDSAGAPVAYAARQVIFAGPRFVAARVIAPWRASPPAFTTGLEYAPWVVANVTLSAPPEGRGFPLCWDNVLYESRSLGYVVATHQRLRASERGPTVLTWYFPLTGPSARDDRTRLLASTYEDWEEIIVSDLSVAHPRIGTQLERIEVMRWGHAMIRPRPGLIWGGALAQARQSVGGRIHFAHTDLSGLALFEEANAWGVRAAEEVLAQLGRPKESWL